MRTPAGVECKYFYGDYYRGRNHEECRLLLENGQKWESKLCRTCPIPSITRANACDSMRLTATIKRIASTKFKPSVQITAFCEKTNRDVREPQIGCGDCHPMPPAFEVEK
jgi:hypothetical protein